MSDVLEAAKSGRSHCRGCRRNIAQGELRYGASQESFYGDGAESYSWFHPKCAAQRMPERAIDVFKAEGPTVLPDFDALIAVCEKTLQKAASKFPYGDRAPTSRAKCMHCKSAIAKGELRVAIEREIDAGGFAQTGAGYLHPKCAVAFVNEPRLAELVASNSSLISAADKTELVTLLEPSDDAPTPKRPARVAQATAKPSAGAGDELVFADQLIEKGDPRGELIVVATELEAPAIEPDKAAALAARAKKLTPEATRAWAKELGLPATSFTLDRGLPVVDVELGTRNELPQHPWITGYRTEGVGGPELARLLASKEFERIKTLVLDDLRVSWESFRAFCTSPNVKHLRSLEIDVNVGARGVHMLFTSKQLESLEHLTIRSNIQATPDLRGFDSVAGLRSLRTLQIAHSMSYDLVAKLLLSPVAKRLEELTIHAWALPATPPDLPNLRRLRVLDFIDAASQKRLQKVFGDRLIATVKPATNKRAAKTKTTRAKATTAKATKAKTGSKKTRA